MRTLILLAKRPDPDLRRRIAVGDEPQTEYLTLARELRADVLDFHDVERDPEARHLGSRLGPAWGLAWLGLRRLSRYDVLYATGEDIGIRLGIALRAVGVRERLAAVIHNAGTPKRRALLRALGGRTFRHVICVSDEQRRVLTEECGLPPEKVSRLPMWIDDRFFRPSEATGGTAGPGEYALSVGMERRDYPTLFRAASQLDYPFHVVASGWSPGSGYSAGSFQGQAVPGNVRFGSGYSSRALRDLYAGARLVVAPLQATTYASGITTILEAMAMGKAVVASDSPGICEMVKDGVSGRLVPVGDDAAMARAADALWREPEALERMGRHNRAWIERDYNNEVYAARAAAVLSGTRPSRVK
jgi:glycosyltransferase involved in cell wall biosynthesis